MICGVTRLDHPMRDRQAVGREASVLATDAPVPKPFSGANKRPEDKALIQAVVTKEKNYQLKDL
jgi:hypothetical protein